MESEQLVRYRRVQECRARRGTVSRSIGGRPEYLVARRRATEMVPGSRPAMLSHSGLLGSERFEAVGLHLEGQVQEVVEVLDRVRERELRDLTLVKVLRQLGEAGVADDLRARGFLDVGERRTLACAEQGAVAPVSERIEALVPSRLRIA